MKGSRYVAIVEEFVGESGSAICSILAKQTSNSLDGFVLDSAEFLLEFYNSKRVFMPKLKQHDFAVGQVIAFTLIESIDVGNKLPRVNYFEPSSAKSLLCLQVKSVPISGSVINIEMMNNDISEVYHQILTRFYISDGFELYGEFKSVNNKIEAYHGLTIKKYSIEDCLLIEHPYYNDVSIILHKPERCLTILDSSTDTQLVDWFKKLLSKSSITLEIREALNHIRKLSVDWVGDELDVERIRRVQCLLNKLEFNYDEFESLRNNNNFWSSVFDDSLANFEESLRLDFIKDNKLKLDSLIKEEKDELFKVESKINEFKVILNKLESDCVVKDIEFVNLGSDISILEEKKRELLLLLQSQIDFSKGNSSSILDNFKTFEIIAFDEASLCYDGKKSLNQFLDSLASLSLSDNQENRLFDAIESLQKNIFFRCGEVKELLSLLHILGNSIIFLNNTEVDWIKFDKFLNQGLIEAIDMAFNNNSKSVYYILQDFNLACPECYAKPLIDFSRGFRKGLPGVNKSWPPNLRIIFIPLELNIDDFGFEVHELTFFNWCELIPPKIERDIIRLEYAYNLEDK